MNEPREVTRYRADGKNEWFEDSTGAMVAHSDYAALRKEAEKLRTERPECPKCHGVRLQEDCIRCFGEEVADKQLEVVGHSYPGLPEGCADEGSYDPVEWAPHQTLKLLEKLEEKHAANNETLRQEVERLKGKHCPGCRCPNE